MKKLGKAHLRAPWEAPRGSSPRSNLQFPQRKHTALTQIQHKIQKPVCSS